MTLVRPISALIISAFVCLLCGCASTAVTTVWKAPPPPPAPFTKIAAIVVNASPAERRAGEDELVRSIKSGKAVASYTLLSDEDIKDKAKVRSVLQQDGFDGAAVIRLVSSNTTTTYVPPTYSPSLDPFDYNYIGGYRGGMPDTYQGGYTTTDTVVTTEASVYSVKEGKLIWAGSSTTTDPSNVQDLVAQVCRSAVAELQRQGLMK